MLCLLCVHSLCPHTSRQWDGDFPEPCRKSSGRPPSQASDETALTSRWVSGLGRRRAGEQTRFCVGVCLPRPAEPWQESAGATPEEAGPRAGLRLVWISRSPPPPSFVPVTSPRPEQIVVAARSPPWAFLATPRFAFPPRFLIFSSLTASWRGAWQNSG